MSFVSRSTTTRSTTVASQARTAATGTLYDPGTVTFTYTYTASQFAELETIFMLATDPETRPQASKQWRITLPDNSVSIVLGFLTKHDLPTELEDSPVVEAEVQCRGAMAYSAGTGA